MGEAHELNQFSHKPWELACEVALPDLGMSVVPRLLAPWFCGQRGLLTSASLFTENFLSPQATESLFLWIIPGNQLYFASPP